jgi:hypothetical protein
MKETKTKRKPAYEIVLNALQAGLTVRLGDREYMMQDDQIVIKVTCYKNGLDKDCEEKMLVIDMTLNNFISLCNQIPENELFGIGCSVALTNMHKEKNR